MGRSQTHIAHTYKCSEMSKLEGRCVKGKESHLLYTSSHPIHRYEQQQRRDLSDELCERAALAQASFHHKFTACTIYFTNSWWKAAPLSSAWSLLLFHCVGKSFSCPQISNSLFMNFKWSHAHRHTHTLGQAKKRKMTRRTCPLSMCWLLCAIVPCTMATQKLTVLYLVRTVKSAHACKCFSFSCEYGIRTNNTNMKYVRENVFQHYRIVSYRRLRRECREEALVHKNESCIIVSKSEQFPIRPRTAQD